MLIGNITSMASLGVYSIAAQFGNIADTVQSYVNSAYGPWVFERLHAREEGYKRVIRENVSFLSAIVGLMLIGIALFAQDYILLLVDPAYADAWRYVPLIVMVFAFKIIYNFHAEALLFNKDASRILFVAALSSGFVSVILTAILIPYLDIYGSIVADMVAMLMRAYITVCISRKYQNIGLRIGDFALNILLILIAVVAGLLPSWLLSGNTFQLSNVFYKIAIVLVYVAVQAVLHRKRLLVISKKLLKQFIARKKQ